MQILKDREIIEDNYRYITDEEIVEGDNISMFLARWQQEKSQLQQHDGKLGVRLGSTDSAEAIANDLADISLIELNFPAFTDGRLFSTAKLLRTRYGYQGEIRAVGQFMVDQVFYLSKVGVNAFQLDNVAQLPVALAMLDDFSVSYQA
jgi:uncharacterized protein (DUF934 family)